jgi:Tol biopolymer transport system component
MKRWTWCVAAVAAFGSPLRAQTASDLFQRAVMAERTAGRLDSAITLYQRVVRQAGADRALAARALLSLGRAYETLGRAEARAAYERLVREYGDQRELAAQARVRIAALNPSAGRSGVSRSGAVAMIRRVSQDQHDFSSGTVSPNGRYASYTDWSTGDLEVLDIAGGRSRRLTSRSQRDKSYAFTDYSVISPNNLEIAYVWSTDSSGVRRRELRVVPLQGGRPRVVRLRDVPYLELYGWAPDGKHLLALVQRVGADVGELALVGVDEPTVHRLRNFGFRAALGASVSLDGKWIAFALPANDERDRNPVIHLIAADGSGEHTLADHPSANWGPMWTPDGRGVAFRSDRTGHESLWFQEVVDGTAVGEPILLKADMGGVWPLGFSRDGRLFFTTTGLRDISVAALDPRTGEVLGAPKIVSGRFVGSNTDPDWSPDGQSLAFVSMRGPGVGMAPGALKVVVVNLATGVQQEFLPRLLSFQHPRWSRDGRSILLWGRETDRTRGFYRLDVTTGAIEALTISSSVSPRPFEWSADGRSVFYGRGDSTANPTWDGMTSIWRYDLADSTHRPVYDPDSLIFARAIAPSPDGRWLAFNAAYRTVRGAAIQESKILSLVTGELRDLPVPSSPTDASVGSRTGHLWFAWLPNGSLLGSPYLSADSSTAFWWVPTDGGTVSKVAFEVKARMIYYPRLAPDGSKIALSITNDDPNAGGIWVMESFLPAPKKGS